MADIRQATDAEWPEIWRMLEPIFRRGDTYAYAPDIDSAAARYAWLEAPRVTYIALDSAGRVAGSYFLKPNQPGQGAHVCNCGYAVAQTARRQGIAGHLCRHSQQIAVELGFRAMQYNFVVSTNQGAIRLWQAEGFDIVGRLPGAFAHPAQGDVDALVMYKTLAE